MSLRRSKRSRTQPKVAYAEPKSDDSDFNDSDSSSSAEESASSSGYSSQDAGRSSGKRSASGGRGRGKGARKTGKKPRGPAPACVVPDLMTISAPTAWVASKVRQQRGGSAQSDGAAAAASPSASSDGEADTGVAESDAIGADSLAAEISAFFDAFGGALHFDPAALAERVRALEREAELARLMALPKSSFKVFAAVEDDTPRAIAAQSGVSLEQFIALNSEVYEGLRPTSRLRRGTKLLLPPAADTAAAADEESIPHLLARAIVEPRTDAVATAMLNATHMVLLQPVLRQVAANAEATWATRQEKALQHAKSKERANSNVVMPDVSDVPIGLTWPQFTTFSAGQYVRDELSLRWKAYRAAEQRRSGGLGSPDVPNELTIDPPLNVLNWRELCRQYVAARLQAMDVTALVSQEMHPETFVRTARTASSRVAVAPPSVDLHTAVGLDWEQYPAVACVSRFDDVRRAVTSEGVYIPHHNQFQGSFTMRLARPGLGRIGAAEDAVWSVGAGRREALRCALVMSAAQRELDRELRAVAFERKTTGATAAQSGASSDSALRSGVRASAPLWDAEAYGSCASDAARSVRESARASASAADQRGAAASSADGNGADENASSASSVDMLGPIGLLPLGCSVGHEWLAPLNALRPKLNEMATLNPRKFITNTIQSVIESGMNAALVTSESFESGSSESSSAAAAGGESPPSVRSSGRRTRRRADDEAAAAAEAAPARPPAVVLKLESFGDPELDAAVVDAHAVARARIFERLRLVVRTRAGPSLVKRRALVVFDEYMRCRVLSHSVETCLDVLRQVASAPEANSQRAALDWLQQSLEKETLGIGGRRTLSAFQAQMRATIRDVAETADESASEALGKEFEKIWRNCGAAAAASKRNRGSEAYSAVNDQLPDVLSNLMTFIRERDTDQEEAAFSAGRRNMESVVRRLRCGYYNGRAAGPSDFASTVRNVWAQQRSGSEATSAASSEADAVIDLFEQQWWRIGGDTSRSSRHGDSTGGGNQDGAAHGASDAWTSHTVADLSPLERCLQVLRRLKIHRSATPFLSAVDLTAAPGYSDLIDEPMDLEEVSRRIRNGLYVGTAGVDRFAMDIRLIWSNCKTYNAEDSDVWRAADAAAREFERLWSVSSPHETRRTAQRRDVVERVVQKMLKHEACETISWPHTRSVAALHRRLHSGVYDSSRGLTLFITDMHLVIDGVLVASPEGSIPHDAARRLEDAFDVIRSTELDIQEQQEHSAFQRSASSGGDGSSASATARRPFLNRNVRKQRLQRRDSHRAPRGQLIGRSVRVWSDTREWLTGVIDYVRLRHQRVVGVDDREGADFCAYHVMYDVAGDEWVALADPRVELLPWTERAAPVALASTIRCIPEETPVQLANELGVDVMDLIDVNDEKHFRSSRGFPGSGAVAERGRAHRGFSASASLFVPAPRSTETATAAVRPAAKRAGCAGPIVVARCNLAADEDAEGLPIYPPKHAKAIAIASKVEHIPREQLLWVYYFGEGEEEDERGWFLAYVYDVDFKFHKVKVASTDASHGAEIVEANRKLLSVQFNWVEAGLDATWHLVSELRIRLANEPSGARAKPEFRSLLYNETSQQWVLEDSALEVGSHANIIGRTVELLREQEHAASMDEDDGAASPWAPYTVVDVSRATGGSKRAVHLLKDRYGALERLVLSERNVRVHYDAWRSASRQERFNEARAAAAKMPCLLEYADQCATHFGARGLRVADAGDGEWRLANHFRVLGTHCDLLGVELSLKRATATEWRAVRVESIAVGDRHWILVLSTGKKELIRLSTVDVRIERPQLRLLVEKIEADARIAAAPAVETMDVDEAPASSSATKEDHGPLIDQSERVRLRRLLHIVPREISMGNSASDLDSKRSTYIGTMVPSRPGAGDTAAYSSQRSGSSDLRVRVKWSFEGRDEWFAGTLRGGAKPLSSASRLCRLVYDDGDEEAIRMPNDAVEVLPKSLQSTQWLRVGSAVYAWIPTFGRVSASHKGGGAGIPHFRWVRSTICGFNADGSVVVRPTGDGDSVNNTRAHVHTNKDRDRDRDRDDSPEPTSFSKGKSRADRLREREDRVEQQPRRKRQKTSVAVVHAERRPVHAQPINMSRVVHKGQLGRVVSRSRGWVQVKLDGVERTVSVRSGRLQRAPPDAPPYVETPPKKEESRSTRKKARHASAAVSAAVMDPVKIAAQRAYEIKRRDEKRVKRALAKRAAARAAALNKVLLEEQEHINIGVRVMRGGERGVVVSRTKAWLYVRFDGESNARPCRKRTLKLEVEDEVVVEERVPEIAHPFGSSYRALAATLGHRSFALSPSEPRAALVEEEGEAAVEVAPNVAPKAAKHARLGRVIMAPSNIWGSRYVKASHRAGNGDLLRAQRAMKGESCLRGAILNAAIIHVCDVLDVLRKEVAEAVDMKPQYLSKLMRGTETSKVKINIWETRLNAWVRHVSGQTKKSVFGPSYLELKRAVRHKPFDDEISKPRKRRGRPSRAAGSREPILLSLASRRSRRATQQPKAAELASEGSSEDEAQSESSEEEEVSVYTVTGPDMGSLLREFEEIEPRVHGGAAPSADAAAAAVHVVNAAPSLQRASRDASADRHADTFASLTQLALAAKTHPAVKFERLDMLADDSEGFPAWSLPLSMLRPAGDEGVVVKVESARCHVRFPHVDSDVLIKYDTVDELRKDARCVGAYDARAAAGVSAPCSAPILEGESAAAFVRRWREQREFEVGRWPVRVQAHLAVTSDAAIPPLTASTITIGEGMTVNAVSIRFSAHLGALLRLNREQHPAIDGSTVLEHGDTLSLPDCSSLESWVERKLVATNGLSFVEALQRTHATSSGSGEEKDSSASTLDCVAASLRSGEYASFAELATDVAQCAEDGSDALCAVYKNEMRALRQRTRTLFVEANVSDQVDGSMPFGQLYWVAFDRQPAHRLAPSDWKLARLVERTQSPVERETALRLQWVFGRRDTSHYRLDALHVRVARLRSAATDADMDVNPIILDTRTVGGEEWVDVAINTDSLLAAQQSKRVDLVRGEQGRFASLVELLGDPTMEYGDFPAEARMALLRILFDAACESDIVRASISEQRGRRAPVLSPRRRSARADTAGAARAAGGGAAAAEEKKLSALGPLPGVCGPDAFADSCCKVLAYVVLDVREWQQEKIDALDRTENDAQGDSDEEASDASKGAASSGAEGAASARAARARAPAPKAKAKEAAPDVGVIATLADIGSRVRAGEIDSEALFVEAVRDALLEMAAIAKKFNRHWAHGKACRQEDTACGMKAARWVHATPTPTISQHGLCAHSPFEALREQLGLMMEALPATAFTNMSEWGRASARRVAWLRLLSRAKTPEAILRLCLLVEVALVVLPNSEDDESEPRAGVASWWSSKASRVPPPAAAIRNGV